MQEGVPQTTTYEDSYKQPCYRRSWLLLRVVATVGALQNIRVTPAVHGNIAGICNAYKFPLSSLSGYKLLDLFTLTHSFISTASIKHNHKENESGWAAWSRALP